MGRPRKLPYFPAPLPPPPLPTDLSRKLARTIAELAEISHRTVVLASKLALHLEAHVAASSSKPQAPVLPEVKAPRAEPHRMR